MHRQIARKVFGLAVVVLLVSMLGVSQIRMAGAQEGSGQLQASAGPDQTVPGPSPVDVEFDGSGSTGPIVEFRWINQFGQVRSRSEAAVIAIDFGKNPKPGAKRTFTLEVTDPEGHTSKDQVTITLGETPKEEAPVADAGPDQTVAGPSPVKVNFDGSGSVGNIADYKWYNQFGELRSEGVGSSAAEPTLLVNFGKNPKPGAKRTFRLVVEDSNGQTDEDTVVITLGKTPGGTS
jgi:hypothetical protein